MTMDEYVAELESKADHKLVALIRDWPTETKLYMYLHHAQLAYMAAFMQVIQGMPKK